VYVPNVVLFGKVHLNLMKIDLPCCSLKSARNIKAYPPVSATGRVTTEILAAPLHNVAVIYPASDIPLMCASFPSAADRFTHRHTLDLYGAFLIRASEVFFS
jgi:hypothetical protein